LSLKGTGCTNVFSALIRAGSGFWPMHLTVMNDTFSRQAAQKKAKAKVHKKSMLGHVPIGTHFECEPGAFFLRAFKCAIIEHFPARFIP
jgi:hypothetical protein